MTTTVAAITAALDERYPPGTAEDWDRVGLVLGRPDRTVRRVLLVVDCVPETVSEAIDVGADLIVAHHPLYLRGTSTVAPTSGYKGRAVHDLIEAGVALYVAHTNADTADPGVSDALADRLGLRDTRPLRPAPSGVGGIGRVGTLPEPTTLAEFTVYAAARLPRTVWGVRAAGDPARTVSTVAVSGGAGDSYLRDATAAGADVFLTADLRHHPAGEHIAEDGPALVDAAHWATERPWLDPVAADLRDGFGVETIVSDLVTDPWTLHSAPPPGGAPATRGADDQK